MSEDNEWVPIAALDALRRAAEKAYWAWFYHDPETRQQMEALYREIHEARPVRPFTLPLPDLDLMDTVGERANPERPVMLQRGPFYDGRDQPPPPPPDRG